MINDDANTLLWITLEKLQYFEDMLVKLEEEQRVSYYLRVIEECKRQKKEIKSLMGNREVLCNEDGEIIVSNKLTSRRRLNEQKLKEKYPDIYQECLDEPNERRLSFNLKALLNIKEIDDDIV